MAAAETCSASSLAAGEPLAGHGDAGSALAAGRGAGAWARDVDETELPGSLPEQVVDGFDGRVQLIRRPGSP